MNWRNHPIPQIASYETACGKNYFSTEAKKALISGGFSADDQRPDEDAPYTVDDLAFKHDELLRRHYLVSRLLTHAISWKSMITLYLDIQNRRRGVRERNLLEQHFNDWRDAQQRYPLDFQDLVDVSFATGAGCGEFLGDSPRIQGALDWAALIHDIAAGRQPEILARHAYSWQLWRFVHDCDGPEYSRGWSAVFNLAQGLKPPGNATSILELIDAAAIARVEGR